MVEKSADAGGPANLVSQTLAITTDQLTAYAIAKSCLRPCDACGNERWNQAVIDDVPALFTLSSARDSSFANWYFEFHCDNCGNVRSLAAGYVWAYFYDTKDKQE